MRRLALLHRTNGDRASFTALPLSASGYAYLPKGNALAYSPACIVLRPISIEHLWLLS
jgi:hypothetical protein